MKSLLIFLGLMVLVTPAGYGQTPAKPHIKEAREVVQELATGQFAKVYARFDEEMRTGLPEARLANVWNGLEAKVGKFERIDAVEVVNSGATVILTCQFEQAKLNTLLTFNDRGQLAGMFFRPAGNGQASGKGFVKEAREVVQELAAGQFAKVYARFDEEMQTGLPEARLAKVWNGLEAKVGKFQRIDAVKVVNDGATVILTCQFEHATLNTVLTFNSSGQLAGMFFRPGGKTAAWTRPAYARPADFTEKAVTVATGRWKLPGTLTMPKGKGPFPGVVLVQGSGPLDQDETVGPNKPFKDLAWGLANQGVAVLRYDKRTYMYGVKSSANPGRLTINDVTVDDARSAVALLAREPGIEPHGIFVLGHSLGAVMAPQIATGDRTVHGIILLAGAITPIERLALEQIRTIDAREHVPAKTAQKRVAEMEKTVRQIESPSLKPGMTVDFLGSPTPASFWLSLRDYHPGHVAARLHIPMLLLQGGRDYQVTPSELKLWKKALAGHKNVTYKLYPSLNHLFEAGTGPSTPREYMKPGRHVDVKVIDEVASWVKAEAGR